MTANKANTLEQNPTTEQLRAIQLRRLALLASLWDEFELMLTNVGRIVDRTRATYGDALALAVPDAEFVELAERVVRSRTWLKQNRAAMEALIAEAHGARDAEAVVLARLKSEPNH